MKKILIQFGVLLLSVFFVVFGAINWCYCNYAPKTINLIFMIVSYAIVIAGLITYQIIKLKKSNYDNPHKEFIKFTIFNLISLGIILFIISITTTVFHYYFIYYKDIVWSLMMSTLILFEGTHLLGIILVLLVLEIISYINIYCLNVGVEKITKRKVIQLAILLIFVTCLIICPYSILKPVSNNIILMSILGLISGLISLSIIFVYHFLNVKHMRNKGYAKKDQVGKSILNNIFLSFVVLCAIIFIKLCLIKGDLINGENQLSLIFTFLYSELIAIVIFIILTIVTLVHVKILSRKV